MGLLKLPPVDTFSANGVFISNRLHPWWAIEQSNHQRNRLLEALIFLLLTKLKPP